MFASGAANAFLYSFVPTLFVEAYGASLEQLGFLTFAAPLGNSVCCVLSGILADSLVKHMRPYQVRMIMQSLGTAVPALCLLATCQLKSQLGAAVTVTLWMASHGFQTSGITALLHDVAHARASELFAMGNVASKFAGILAGPLVSRQCSRSCACVRVFVAAPLGGLPALGAGIGFCASLRCTTWFLVQCS